jgi:hypothetical protein
MGFGVAHCARWCILVFVLMAKYATQIVMLALTVSKKRHGILMTGPAIMRRGVLRIGNHQRHVGRVARHAGLEIHVLGVFFVAIHAAWNLAMGRVALVAGQIRMGAGVRFHLVTLLRVTGQASFRNFTFQHQIERGVGVSVTA